MFKHLWQGLFDFINTIWLLFILGPLYIFFSVAFIRLLQIIYVVTRDKNSKLYSIVGDISSILPFSSVKEIEIKFTNVVLVSILLALISLISLVICFYNKYCEEAQRRNADLKRLASSVSQPTAAASESSQKSK
eukprot:TRINITY_DN9368_c0_g1_i1.p1 TRINITY_DN9368_c0_g1~~TRINITY_DN9368_c0_g1_i1.p1  ORF type:complete len:134 (+),score=41.88 TRINITY_DN9368_c0_g1_i1:134-535(+)